MAVLAGSGAGIPQLHTEQFHDYTVASGLERFAASLEACLTTWRDKELARRRATDGNAEVHLQAQLQHRLPFRAEPYTLSLHLPQLSPAAERSLGQLGTPPSPLASALELRDAPHRLQQWFGARAFLLIAPESYSGRVLDEEEVHTLLSAAAVALSHARITWPLLLPVHDAVRDSYRGVAIAPCELGAATVQFNADSLSSSRLPPRLLQLEGQLLLFAQQLAAGGAPAASAACHAATGAAVVNAPPASMAADAEAAGGAWPTHATEGGSMLCVAAAVRHSYALPSRNEEAGSSRDSSSTGDAPRLSSRAGEWDEDALWRPWAAQADPVGCLELDLAWRFPNAAEALHSQARDPAAAEWRLLALGSNYERDTGHRGFVLRSVEKPRRFLQLQSIAGEHARLIRQGRIEVAPAALPGESSFFGMLLTLLEGSRWAARASALGSLASPDWWPQQGAYFPPAPPDWVLQEAIRDIFQLPVLPSWPAADTTAVAWPASAAGQHGCLGKAAPLGALVSRFALHALALGSPRAVADLWSRFVGTLRQIYWEQQLPLPRMRLGDAEQDPQAPDLRSSLLHQKLQLLDLCIHRQKQQEQSDLGQKSCEGGSSAADDDRVSSPSSSAGSSYFSAATGSEAHVSPDKTQQVQGQARVLHAGPEAPSPRTGTLVDLSDVAGAAVGLAVAERRASEGVAHVLPGARLHLLPGEPLRVPLVQEPPPHTEDLAAEMQVAQQLSPAAGMPEASSGAQGTHLQRRMLLSDMQAFKAANPGCCLLDFVRWHSPKDCCQAADGSWELSNRMAAEGNTWQQLWASAPAIPAAAQRPLFDVRLEGERALHFLETLPPPILFADLLALGFSAAVQLLELVSKTVDLPSVQEQLRCLVAAAGPAMQHGVAAVGGGGQHGGTLPHQEHQVDGAAAGGSGNSANLPPWVPALHSGALSASSFQRVLLLLGCTEQVVVAAHSLLQRLGERKEAACPAGSSPSAGSREFAPDMADTLLAAALGSRQQSDGGDAAVAAAASADLAVPYRHHVETLLLHQLEWQDSTSERDCSGNGSLGEDACSGEEAWPAPFQREWLLEVCQGGSDGGSGDGDSRVSSLVPCGAVLHRMYVKALPAEVRVATAVSCEPAVA